MSATTLVRPACGRQPGVCPAPERCLACGEADAACDRCKGGGWEAARFDLLPSRTFELRRVRYEPRAGGVGVLSLWLLKKKTGWKEAPPWTEYHVAETDNQFGGRSFLVVKVGTDRSHNVILGPKGLADCECEGRTYMSSARANERAYDAGGEVFRTLGCIHKDSLHALLKAGFFDLLETVPCTTTYPKTSPG